MRQIIEKVLSANDVGATGSHQAGILIPKQSELLSFFPELDRTTVNPRVELFLTDNYEITWKFVFVYYNNKLRGGTRNEFRLTGMTSFFRRNNAKQGDVLVFEKEGDEYFVRMRSESEQTLNTDGSITLILDNSWKIIQY